MQSIYYRALEAAQQALRTVAGDRERAETAFTVLRTLADGSPDAGNRACRAGCTHCCRHPVGITYPEALALLRALGELPPELRTRLAARTKAAAAATAESPFAALGGLPCPLLEGGRCAVYESRPIPCRAFASADAEACERARWGPAEVPIDRHALVAGLGVASALAALAPAGHRELRSALAALHAAPPKARLRSFLDSRPAG